MIYLLLPFLFLSTIVRAQKTTVDLPDQLILPDPYKKAYFDDQNDYTKVRSVTILSRNKVNNFQTDTLYKTFYDDFGKRIKEVSYSKNVPSSVTTFTYNESRNLKESKYVSDYLSQVVAYTYAQQEQIASTQNYHLDLKSGDSTLFSNEQYIYTRDGLVEILTNGSLHDQYTYKDHLLQNRIGANTNEEFLYDKNGNLIRATKYQNGEPKEERLNELRTFQYDSKNRLIKDSLLTSSNIVNKDYQITSYSYEEEQLKEVKVVYKTQYRNIQFSYEDGKIKQITIVTNESNSAYLRHWISSKISQYYSFPITYCEVFDYDAYGNKVSRKDFVNDELFSETEYVIHYKKTTSDN